MSPACEIRIIEVPDGKLFHHNTLGAIPSKSTPARTVTLGLPRLEFREGDLLILSFMW
jgi:hypothetical protein